MGTLMKLKLKMKFDRDLRHAMVRGSKHEILLDLDGDKLPDIAIMDLDKDGDIDALAVDLDGNGELSFFIVDTDHNGIPDQILYEDDNGELQVLAAGPEVEQAIVNAAILVEQAIAAGEYIAKNLDLALDDMEKEIKKARKSLKKLSK